MLGRRATPYVVRLANMGKHCYPPPLSPITAAAFAELLSGEPKSPRAHLYVHLPFCESICSFCVLHKFQLRPGSPVEAYVAAVRRELEALSRLPLVRRLRFNTVYFGGGTPSVVPDRHLAELMETIAGSFTLEPDVQCTFEGHVGSLTAEKVRFVRGLGFNRLSTGVQTFDPEVRRRLNLTPSGDDLRRVERDARAAGFDDFNFDLMYNLPGQTLAAWERDLEQAVGLSPSGVDCYETVVSRRTALGREVARGEVALERDQRRLAAAYLLAEEFLATRGFRQRNVHVWDRDGYENRLIGQQHHLRDQELTLVGAGLSAYSFIDGRPYINVTGLHEYIERVAAQEFGVEAFHDTTPAEAMERFMTLSLETIDLDAASFRRLFGREMDEVFAPQLASFARRGLIAPAGDSGGGNGDGRAGGYRLTALGRAWASTMTVEFFGPAVFEEFMRARLGRQLAPGYAADITHEEMFEFAVFAAFHPEVMFKGRPDFELLRAHARLLSRLDPGWRRAVARQVATSALRFGPPPLGWYARAGWRLLRGEAAAA